MKTISVKIRIDPAVWKRLMSEAAKQDRTTPQLIRLIIKEWFESHDRP
jgi:hypothetical protein